MQAENPPLTPPDCDLTDFQYMELDVRQLRDSNFAATVDAEAFRAGVLLWCASWHQVPAGSLPDDDIQLASLAGYGRVIKEWRKVRDDALYGFVKCTDGRLYHTIIATKAVAAYEQKQRYAYDKLRDRIRKENKARTEDGRQPLGFPTFEQWKSGEHREGIPPESTNSSGGNPAENPLRGNRTEQNGDIKPSVPDGTGANAPPKSPAELTKHELWAAGKSLLAGAGMPAAQCGSFVGKLVKDYGDALVVDAVRSAVVEQPADPASFLKACCQRLAGERKPGAVSEKFSVADADFSGSRAAMEEANRRHGIAGQDDDSPL